MFLQMEQKAVDNVLLDATIAVILQTAIHVLQISLLITIIAVLLDNIHN